jgi:amino acid adenylation domain-containing protein
VTANHFRLPAAWRPSDVDNILRLDTVVLYGDLAAALPAYGPGRELTTLLVAAHAKVLSMLTEERSFRTDISGTPHQDGARTLTVDRPAAGTWRELVDQVHGAQPGIPAPAPDAGGPERADRVLFTDGEPDRRYGLCVCVRDGWLRWLRLSVSASAVDREGLIRLASMYQGVLTAMAGSPDGDAVAAHLPDAERQAVLRRWAAGPAASRPADPAASQPADPAASQPADPAASGPAGTVVQLFEAQAARTPEATAVTVSGRSITYRELEERSNQIAGHLVGQGARPEVLVGVCLRRTADLLPALFGVWKSGAACLPLDADLPAPRLRRMVAGSGCHLLLTNTGNAPTLSDGDGDSDSDGRRFVLLDAERDAIAALARTPPGVPVGPANLAYVMYTSGSTGAPKGVMVQHGGLANYLHWTADEYAAGGTGGSAFFTSIGFDLGVPSLLTPLLVGQRVDLLPDPLDIADLGALLAAGAPYSFLKMTPGHLNLLSLDLDPGQAAGLAGLVIAAGDGFPAGLARRWMALAGAGGTAVATEYGPTEITIGNSGQRITDADSAGLLPLGVPIPNTTMYVLTGELEPTPVGVPGEVYVGGAGVSRGYLGDPALTADRFVPDPYGPPGARLYRTGDRARWGPSGALEFLGRNDQQVKIRGYRVEPGEIQETLRRHPDVDEAVVILCDQPGRSSWLAAFVIAAPGGEVDVRRLRADLAADLPAHMVPSEIVAVGAIPLTANGKVDTRALRADVGTASPEHAGKVGTR